MNKRALIAMSGGVDSSVAAFLIKSEGFESMGVTMKLFANEDIGVSREHSCCSLADVEDARSVACRLGIPYYVFNFSDGFESDVIKPFIASYEKGLTPNPCIECNRHLKFERLYNRAKVLGCDYVATGHYARIEKDSVSGRYLLKKAVDDAKDQSYVLYSMTQDQLEHTLFPLGSMCKQETRRIAEEQGFINAHKHESQDICFVQNGKYCDFIEEYTGKKYDKGPFVDTDGNILGSHNGIIRYTVGQRKGLGLALNEPMYVRFIDAENNTVVLGRDSQLYSETLTAKNINLISVPRIRGVMHLKAKIRYRQEAQWASVTQPDIDTLSVVFDKPQRAITGGQAVVLYDGDVVVGGGTIE